MKKSSIIITESTCLRKLLIGIYFWINKTFCSSRRLLLALNDKIKQRSEIPITGSRLSWKTGLKYLDLNKGADCLFPATLNGNYLACRCEGFRAQFLTVAALCVSLYPRVWEIQPRCRYRSSHIISLFVTVNLTPKKQNKDKQTTNRTKPNQPTKLKNPQTQNPKQNPPNKKPQAQQKDKTTKQPNKQKTKEPRRPCLWLWRRECWCPQQHITFLFSTQTEKERPPTCFW